jgi:hypothetical protein
MTATEGGTSRLSRNVGTTSLRSVTSQKNEINFYSSWTACPLKTKLIGFLETSVIKYKYTVRNIPEERSSCLCRGKSLKLSKQRHRLCFLREVWPDQTAGSTVWAPNPEWEKKNFPSTKTVQTNSGANASSYSMGTEALSGSKPGRTWRWPFTTIECGD